MTHNTQCLLIGLFFCAVKIEMIYIALLVVGFMEAPSEAFLLFFLLPDWLKLNHLKSRIECGFQTFFRAIFVPP